ncbi:hypothetical protein SORBI_3008G042250 [Sorghum bicolor]|uniref:Uncharacterized protein n=1 Tax=Sorghum bicolor TaxID=4558 RepID=A0A1Z5R5N3_SORBI|nr:hypothetical protein SORBI_3008G042250 [Sorghum bicolor]
MAAICPRVGSDPVVPAQLHPRHWLHPSDGAPSHLLRLRSSTLTSGSVAVSTHNTSVQPNLSRRHYQ